MRRVARTLAARVNHGQRFSLSPSKFAISPPRLYRTIGEAKVDRIPARLWQAGGCVRRKHQIDGRVSDLFDEHPDK